MKSVPAIAFEYRPSRWLLLAIILVACVAAGAIAFSGLNVWFKVGLEMAAIVYAAHGVLRFLRPPFTHVTWHSAGHWRLRPARDEEQVGELTRAVVLGAMIVLTLRVGSRRVVVLPILPDVCDAQTRRQLRVRLSRANAVGAQ
jgi:toxin CptA